MIKTIGNQKKLSPAECLQKIEELNAEMDKLRPYKKAEGACIEI